MPCRESPAARAARPRRSTIFGFLTSTGVGTPGIVRSSFEIELDRAAVAHADLLAVEIARLLVRRRLLHEVALRLGPVGRGHPEPLHAVGVDGARAVGDVPAVAPLAGRDLRPGRGDEAGLDAERLGDQLAGVGVVAVDLVGGQLVLLALRAQQALGALDRVGLRRVRRIGREHERPAGEHLRELVDRRVAGRLRGLASPPTTSPPHGTGEQRRAAAIVQSGGFICLFLLGASRAGSGW